MTATKHIAIGSVIFSLLFSISASVASAQPFEYCKFETKEGAQCPAATYAGNQTPFPNANCSGTPTAEQVCCCAKKPENTKPNIVPVTTQKEPLLPQLQVTIPGFNAFSASKCTNGLCETPWIGEYIKALYDYGLIIVGVLAVIVMMIGGILWLTAGGNQERIGQGKGFIRGGVFGITLGICSYLILFIINPNLTVLPPINVGYINKEDLPDVSDYQEVIDNGGKLPTTLKTAPMNIVTVPVETINGTKNVQVDKTIEEMIKKTFKDVKDKNLNIYEVGGYRDSKFCHGKGLAIDINVNENYCIDCYGKRGAKVGNFFRPAGPGAGTDYTLDAKSANSAMVKIFKDNGWCWGGDWKSFKDYMHFSTPTCRNGAECHSSGLFDFGKSVKINHTSLGISYP